MPKGVHDLARVASIQLGILAHNLYEKDKEKLDPNITEVFYKAMLRGGYDLFFREHPIDNVEHKKKNALASKELMEHFTKTVVLAIYNALLDEKFTHNMSKSMNKKTVDQIPGVITDLLKKITLKNTAEIKKLSFDLVLYGYLVGATETYFASFPV